MRHTINRQTFELNCNSEDSAKSVSAEVENYVIFPFTEIISGVLAALNVDGSMIMIDKIEVDLGDLELGEIESLSTREKFKQLLEAEIKQHISPHEPATTVIRTSASNKPGNNRPVASANSIFLLDHWLRKGALPWWADKTGNLSIEQLFKSAFSQNPSKLKDLISEIPDELLFTRLTSYLGPAALEKLSDFIPSANTENISTTIFSKIFEQAGASDLITWVSKKVKSFLKSENQNRRNFLRTEIKEFFLKQLQESSTRSLNVATQKIREFAKSRTTLLSSYQLEFVAEILRMWKISTEASYARVATAVQNGLELEWRLAGEDDGTDASAAESPRNKLSSTQLRHGSGFIEAAREPFLDGYSPEHSEKSAKPLADDTSPTEAAESKQNVDKTSPNEGAEVTDLKKQNAEDTGRNEVEEVINLKRRNTGEPVLANSETPASALELTAGDETTRKPNTFGQENTNLETPTDRESLNLETLHPTEKKSVNSDSPNPANKESLERKDEFQLPHSIPENTNEPITKVPKPDSLEIALSRIASNVLSGMAERFEDSQENETLREPVQKTLTENKPNVREQLLRQDAFFEILRQMATIFRARQHALTSESGHDVNRQDQPNELREDKLIDPAINTDPEARDSDGLRNENTDQLESVIIRNDAGEIIDFLLSRLDTNSHVIRRTLELLPRLLLDRLASNFRVQDTQQRRAGKDITRFLKMYPLSVALHVLKLYYPRTVQSNKQQNSTSKKSRVTAIDRPGLPALKLSHSELFVFNEMDISKPPNGKEEFKLMRKQLKKLPDEGKEFISFLAKIEPAEITAVLEEQAEEDTILSFQHENEANSGANEKLYIENAGLCLVAVYLGGFFKQLGYIEKGKFANKVQASRAVQLLQFIATGKKKTAEYQLQLNKVLCGMSTFQSIHPRIRLTKKETDEADELLGAVLEHWKTLKSTSIDGFRTSFLQRKGILEEDDLKYTLRVEKQGFDMLLNTIPWGYTLIKLPWMKKHLQVEW